MGRVYERIEPAVQEWIAEQHLFFVATAPDGADGHVNLSPKGYDTLRILSPDRVAYLDLTGSGVETVAHLRQNGRITFMFCAFDGPPRIVRLFGTGRVADVDDPTLAGAFPSLRGARAIIDVTIDRVGDSCGYSVPLMDYRGERDRLIDWANHRSDEELVQYRAEKNSRSIDGLPAL